MQIISATFLALLLVTVTSPALAQDANGETGEKTAEQTNEQAAQQKEAQDTPPLPGNNERFIPTEEISEDLSVSFPVDI